MLYKKIRYLGSDCHVYEFNQANRHIALEYGKPGILEPLSRMAKGAEVKINCGFFAFNASSENYGIWSNGWTTVCYDENGGQLLKFYDPETMDIGTYNSISKANTLTLGASYTLVENGVVSIRNTDPFPHYTQRHPRTMLAQKQNRNMLFIVVDGRKWNQKGMSAKEQAQLCVYLGARCAVNFDGGGSSEMVVGDKIVNVPSDGGERRIGTCLAAYKK
jgi:exopolysaccharide biosynthesis protein